MAIIRRITLLVMMASLMLSTVHFSTHATDPDKTYEVILINSYHSGFIWTDEQVTSIIKTLNSSNKKINLSIEYLDWKNHPNDSNLDLQYELLDYKYKDHNFDLILTTDDLAMQFALDYREALFDNAPIVFGSVNKLSALNRIGDATDITGVFEEIDPEGTIDAILSLHDSVDVVYIITENTESGLSTRYRIAEAFEALSLPIRRIDLSALPVNEIEQILMSPEENSVAIMASYSTDIYGTVKEPIVYLQEIVEHSAIPIYGIHEHTFGYGIVGGSLLSASLQGDEIARLGLRVLDGTNPDNMLFVEAKTVILEFDYDYLDAYDIDRNKLPKYALVINEPFSIYNEYGIYILLVLLVLAILITLLIYLSINIRIRKKAEMELLREQESIAFMAYNDSLTKLPNRLRIKSHTETLMLSLNNDEKLAFYFIDLDDFKYINNSYGHKLGDELLQHVALRFKDVVMSHSDQYSIVGRIGGDEFVVVKKGTLAEHEAFSKKLLDLFNTPFYIDKKQIYTSASIGYGIYPDDGLDYNELLVHADMAMFKMKELGKCQVARFSEEMDDDMRTHITYQNHLRDAVLNNELSLLYQPQVNILSNDVVGYEALIRWHSQELGLIMPNIFIPIAEISGLIIPIGEWIIEEACNFSTEMNASRDALTTVSINISIVQLMQQDFAKMVEKIFKKTKVDAKTIIFEITESVFAENFEIINKQLLDITHLGIRIALDDFGTGYSSLTYLKRLPISILKIDKKFIDGIIDENKNHFFTSTIIDLGHNLGVDIIAEGVEHDEQLEYLRKRQCFVIQGYLFSRPISADNAKLISFK